MQALFKPDQPVLLGLLLTLILVCLPHFNHLPLWVSLAFILSVLWRYAHDKYALVLPNQIIKILLLVIIVVGILLTYHSITGRDAGVALLVLLVGLKLLEMREFREILLLLFLSYFLILTNFLYSQSIFSAIYLLFIMLLSTALLIKLADKGRLWSNRQCLVYSGRLLAQAIPLMLVLFIFFPRIEGPFWRLPEHNSQNNVSGMSDSLELGNISALSLSDAVAFRVLFDGKIPPPSQRYWRGLVLSNADNKRWTQSKRYSRDPAFFEPLGEIYQYTITLEPHQKNWLYSLDMPTYKTVSRIKGATLKEDYHIHSDYPINSLKQYRLSSYSNYKTYFRNQRQADLQWRDNLRLPENAHPKTRALAQQWQNEDATSLEIVKKAMQYFATEPFYYTLEPPPLNGDVIDGFLFETRSGFCEHYAAAFVTLMRAASVPARIVVGYQGGSMNPFGDYLTIRQRDAHAWAEVWLEDQGWLRVDPTTAVSPLRIESGIESALPEVLNPLGFSFNNIAWIQQFRQLWDVSNNYWNQWILGYGSQHQTRLLKYFNIELRSYQALVIGLIVGLSSLLAILTIWLLIKQQQQKLSKLSQLYQQFCAKMADCGLQRLPHEGADTFAIRAIKLLPAQATQIRFIINLYVRLAYRIRTTPSQQELSTFKHAVLNFKVKPQHPPH